MIGISGIKVLKVSFCRFYETGTFSCRQSVGPCPFHFICVYQVALYVLRSSKDALMIRHVVDLAFKPIRFNLSYVPTS